MEQPFDWLGRVRNAGSVFLGRYCPEPLGDYFAGPNHTLPTMGTARFSSPLGVDDFVKRSYFSYYTAEGLESVADDVALFADTEGLHAARGLRPRIRRRGRRSEPLSATASSRPSSHTCPASSRRTESI